MNYKGILIGAGTFLIIGIFHPLVIWAEYHFSKKVWPLFALGGCVFLGFAVFAKDLLWSALLAITGGSCFWSIHELFAQEERVKKGWFPKKKG